MNKQELIKYFKKIREDFPVLKQKVNGHDLIYVDNAATTQKPQIVIDSIVDYYTRYNANVHRGGHSLGIETTEKYEEVRIKTAKFINAKEEEIIFTQGTTDSINIVAEGLKHLLKKGDEIVLSYQEHHANIVAWQDVANKTGAIVKFLELDKNYIIDIKKAEKIINKKTKIVSISHISNVLGSINDIKTIEELTHKQNAYFLLDVAQSICHKKIDVKKINCDFLAFSGHKMLAPTGTGVLFGKLDILNNILRPTRFGGGGQVIDVDEKNFKLNDGHKKFETGTPNISGVIGLGIAIDYIQKIGIKNIEEYEKILTEYFLEQIKSVKELQLIGTKIKENRSPVFSFDCNSIHPHDLTTILDLKGVAIRGGSHCAIPLIKLLNTCATSRVSLIFYNTLEEIDKIIEVLKGAKQIFENGKYLL